MRFTKELQPKECIEGDTVEFLCEVSKEAPVTWLKEGKPISPSDMYQITSEGLVHKLVISKADLNDEGDYKVVAGPAQTTASLLVDGKFGI